MTTHDARFAGLDERLIAVAEALGLDVGALDARTLPDAVADAIEARGLPPYGALPSLVADLVRLAADVRAGRFAPVGLPPAEVLTRRRLQLLAEALATWRATAALAPRYASTGHSARGLAGVFRDVARREGSQVEAVRRWCYTDALAQTLIDRLRPATTAGMPRKARRGSGKAKPLGDAGAALQSAWKGK